MIQVTCASEAFEVVLADELLVEADVSGWFEGVEGEAEGEGECDLCS